MRNQQYNPAKMLLQLSFLAIIQCNAYYTTTGINWYSQKSTECLHVDIPYK